MARRYARDNRGRFSSTGATARGGRLATAGGNKRATQTTKLSGGKAGGTVAKPKGLAPQSARSLRTGVAVNRMRGINAKTDRPDIAAQHIPGRFKGQAGKRLDASIDRAAKQVKASEQARLMKPKAQVRAERAARAKSNRQAAAAKPKRTRTAESQRMSRAKQVEKRRSITTNPAGERASAAANMAANAARTQQRAIAFLKNGGKPSPSASAQGRIKQFTDMKKVTDTEIRKVRQEIKDARSNATTFGAVPGLRLRLLELQSQSKRHKDTIASAKASIQK